MGCPIWGQKEWVGHVYPPKTQPKDFLKFYSQQFNSIELNTTFYRIPDSKTINHWKSTVPPGFKFCPKVFQGISHSPHLLTTMVKTRELTRLFCELMLQLQDSLGVCFLQLPQHFTWNQRGILKSWFEFLPRDFPLMVEFRHSSWFENQGLKDDIYTLFIQKRIGTVITDTLGRRDVLHASISSDTLLVRFLGNQGHPSDYSRIQDWISKLKDWTQIGLRKVYFFVHQPNDVYAPELVSYFIQNLNQKLGLSLENWVPYKEPEPEQMTFL